MDENESLLIKRIEEIEVRLSKVESQFLSINSVPSNGIHINKVKSPKEFLLNKNPKDDVQKTFYLGYFLEKEKGKENFSVDDLKEAFRAAKIPLPQNIHDKVNKNISKGLFMDGGLVDGKKTWMLTATGEQVYEELSKTNKSL